jgi:predicted nucleic acid-binding protein
MFVLDTDIVGNLRKRKPHPNLLSWMGRVGWDELSTTVLTIMEIQIGIERARRVDPEVASKVEVWLDGLLDDGAPQIEPLDAVAARLLGRMHETAALRNFIVPDPDAKKTKTGADLAIAAIAIVRGSVIATNNGQDYLTIHRHFELPGLFNPFDGQWLVPSAAYQGR